MVKWNTIVGTGKTGVSALREFAVGNLNCEDVQVAFRNKYPEASSELRRVIRTRGTMESRRLARKALRRRNLMD